MIALPSAHAIARVAQKTAGPSRPDVAHLLREKLGHHECLPRPVDLDLGDQAEGDLPFGQKFCREETPKKAISQTINEAD